MRTDVPAVDRRPAPRVDAILDRLGVGVRSGDLAARTPITGRLARRAGAPADVDTAVAVARRGVPHVAHHAGAGARQPRPPPRRAAREHKDELGELVSIEAGKIRSEGLGEVQEMIDICDFAVGLSRQLHGLTIASERPGHRLMETWHPMGRAPSSRRSTSRSPCGRGTPPRLVCGNPVLWKPSDKTPLTALACDACSNGRRPTSAPAGAQPGAAGRRRRGRGARRHEGVAIVSATGSTRMGRAVAPVVAGRFGRLILELGGNNADHRARRRPRPGRPRHRLLGRRHGRPALHQPAPARSSTRVARRARRPPGGEPTPACRSAIRWPTARWWAR